MARRPPPDEAEEAHIREVVQQLQDYLDGPVFAAQMQKARTIKVELDAATDRMNDAIREVEALLREKFAGRAAAIEVDDTTALMFWRVAGKWGLYVAGGDGQMRPLLNASRHIRKEACNLLPEIIFGLDEAES